MKKTLKIIVIAVLSIIIFISAVVASSRLFFAAPPRRGMDDMLQCFEINREAVFTVRDYFADSEYMWLVYPHQSGMVWVGDDNLGIPTTYFINNSDTKEALNLLIRDGYVRIQKWRGLITFTRWQRGGANVGIIYSADGSIPTPGTIYFLSKLVPLEYDGWYYFETNYNESRIPPEQGIDDMRGEFEENMESIFVIRDYFVSLEYDVLHYPIAFRESTNNRGVMYVGAPRNNWEPRTYMEIGNADANVALELLHLHGYFGIRKRDGFIIFIRWARGGVGVGLVYSVTGIPPDSCVLPYLSVLEPSDIDGWFYYETNSRGWRR